MKPRLDVGCGVQSGCSTATLLSVYAIVGKQKMTFEHVSTLMLFQVRAALLHLKLEEAISEDNRYDRDKSYAETGAA